jgi:hypothetical protein
MLNSFVGNLGQNFIVIDRLNNSLYYVCKMIAFGASLEKKKKEKKNKEKSFLPRSISPRLVFAIRLGNRP